MMGAWGVAFRRRCDEGGSGRVSDVGKVDRQDVKMQRVCPVPTRGGMGNDEDEGAEGGEARKDGVGRVS